MKQSKKQSWYEACTQTSVAFCISLVVGLIVLPLYFQDATALKTVEVTLIYTAISVARGYIIRRWFNRKVNTNCEHGEHLYGHWVKHEGTGTELGTCSKCGSYWRRNISC